MYIDSTGTSSGRFALNAVNADSADKLNSSAGSHTQFIYFSDGKPQVSTLNLGSNTKPVYISNGSFIALSQTIGSNIKPIYMDKGDLKVSTSTVGSNLLPVYLKDGTITACAASALFSAFSQSSATTTGSTISLTVAGQKRDIVLNSASDSTSGVVTTGAQTFAGAKTFTGAMSVSSSITATGRVNANGKVSIPSTGGLYIIGKTPSNASIEITTQTTTNYHPLLAIQTQNGHYINLGAIADKIGFFGFKSTRTENGYDSGLIYDVSSGAVSATKFSGALEGNAATASKWQNARTLSWTGDATGSMTVDGTANKSAALTLANSGVSAGSYGPSSNASPGASGTFSVPYITVDTKGRVTAASTKTITMSADTHWTTRLYAGASGTASNSSATNPYIKVTDNNTYRNQVQLKGSGATTVTSDASGNITISSTNTTYTSLKNPYALTVKGNGTTLATYDGSSATSVNLTYSNVGAAAASHSHSYLPLSGGTLTGVLNCFGGGLKIGSSSESVSMTYNTSSDTLTITFP